MKKLVLIVGLLFFGCYDSTYDTASKEKCDKYTDLCKDGGTDVYYVCADGYGSWFEVQGTKYFTTEYMMMEECGW